MIEFINENRMVHAPEPRPRALRRVWLITISVVAVVSAPVPDRSVRTRTAWPRLGWISGDGSASSGQDNLPALALELDFESHDLNPYQSAEKLAALNPLKRIPVIEHDGFTLADS